MSVEDRILQFKSIIGYIDFKETVDDLIVNFSDDWIKYILGSQTFFISYGSSGHSIFKIESVSGKQHIYQYRTFLFNIEKNPKDINRIFFEYLDRNMRSILVYNYILKLENGSISDFKLDLSQVAERAKSENMIIEIFHHDIGKIHIPRFHGNLKDFLYFIEKYKEMPKEIQISFIKEFNEKLIELDKNPELKLPKNIIGEFNDFVKSTRLNKHQKEVLVNIMTKGNWESKIDSN